MSNFTAANVLYVGLVRIAKSRLITIVYNGVNETEAYEKWKLEASWYREEQIELLIIMPYDEAESKARQNGFYNYDSYLRNEALSQNSHKVMWLVDMVVIFEKDYQWTRELEENEVKLLQLTDLSASDGFYMIKAYERKPFVFSVMAIDYSEAERSAKEHFSTKFSCQYYSTYAGYEFENIELKLME